MFTVTQTNPSFAIDPIWYTDTECGISATHKKQSNRQRDVCSPSLYSAFRLRAPVFVCRSPRWRVAGTALSVAGPSLPVRLRIAPREWLVRTRRRSDSPRSASPRCRNRTTKTFNNVTTSSRTAKYAFRLVQCCS